MITEEQKELNKIYKQKLAKNKAERIASGTYHHPKEKKIRLRQEFVVWTKRMREMYMDFCDDDKKEVSKEGFIKFLNDNDE